MADLFQMIEDRKEDHNVDVMVTFLEIYNEEIRDLLAETGTPTPRGGLQIREDKVVKVVGLVELRPMNADEVKQIVLQGNSRRTQSPTHANETSSRSHAVLQVHVTQSPRTASITEQRTMGTLSIIDLAGSERAAATTNMGQRMVEGANINKSLLALGNCINALCESGGAVRHVPYRNSKLTRLLKFSLGGNCKTVMIVCVAPTSLHFDDTHNTLVYAERATKIKTKVVTRNVVNVDRHVGQYVEAITRLNLEVSELKAKLAGKRDAEAEKEHRRKKEALLEVERAKNDMQLKMTQTQPSLADGGTCAGKISVAETKLKVIRARLMALDSQASSSGEPLPADLEAERGLLKALAEPEEQAVKPQSALHVRLQRSSNSGAMFEATLRAVSERRSDKLDEASIDNVKLDARWRKSEMDRVKAEAQRDALQQSVEAQTETVVNLIGMVGRCTVMLGEASRILKTAAEEGKDGMEATVKALAISLKNIADGNDEAFKALLGHTTAQYALAPNPQASFSLDTFKGYPTTLGHGRVSSGPAVLQSKPKSSRRSSSFGSTIGSPLRKAHKSPRKSLRTSFGGLPYRRVSDNNKGKKKGVHWRDEEGQGDIDDGGLGSAPTIAVTATDKDAITVFTSPSDPPASSIPLSGSRRNVSIAGSESEWEDEKTDESFSLSFLSNTSRDHNASTSSIFGDGYRPLAKRPRSSHLNPGFLKSRARVSTLGSLAEDDEERALSQGSPRRKSPLTARNMNRVPSPTSSSSSTGGGVSSLHVPKIRDKHMSPTKRAPMSPKVVGLSSSKSGRRRSNIGPMRVERPRRRSSLIPQLSPTAMAGGSSLGKSMSGGPRRIALERSPAKRPKRASLLAIAQASKVSQSKLRSFDPNSSADISFRSNASSRPSWR